MDTDEHSERELDLYAENTSELSGQFTAIIANVGRRLAKGTYDAALAPKLWRYWYDEAARRYKREFGYQFPPAVRQACAESRATGEVERIQAGEYVA